MWRSKSFCNTPRNVDWLRQISIEVNPKTHWNVRFHTKTLKEKISTSRPMTSESPTMVPSNGSIVPVSQWDLPVGHRPAGSILGPNHYSEVTVESFISYQRSYSRNGNSNREKKRKLSAYVSDIDAAMNLRFPYTFNYSLRNLLTIS